MTQALLSIKDLKVQFGPKDAPLTAVRGVSLEVGAGEIVGLIGESGSGKSVTCRSVMRLVHRPGRIAAGSITYDGTDVLAMDKKALRDFRSHHAGMIYQDPFSSLNPVRSIGSQLTETLRVNLGMGKAEAGQHAIELLDGVGIPEPDRRVRSYPHELSGGQRQRVMIALATASRPKLLLADEPTTALDVTTQAQILDLICRLRDEQGIGVLIVSHDFGVIAQVCDRVAVMYGGYIVESAPIATIYERPEHPYTKALLESVPDLESAGQSRRREGIRGAPPELSELGTGCPFVPRCDHAVDSCATVSMALERIGADHVSACPVRPFTDRATGSDASLERVA
jgi:oligopeptide/dipeptide ABC transporter ATP-binding protein